MRRRLKRISACLLAGIVLLTSMTGYAAQNGGESAEEVVQRLHAIALAGLPASVHARSAGQTEHLTTGTQIDYYGSRTRRYTVNGEEAYCVEPRVSGPSSGDYRVTEAYTVDTEGHGALDIRYLRAAMWFSYGAPGFDKSMWPDTYYDGTTMDADDYRVCSHLLVSKVFQNGSAAVKVGCTAGFYNWYWRYITGDYRNDASIDRKNPWNQIAFDGRVNEVPDTFRVYFLYTGTGTQLIAFWDYEPEGYVRLVKGAKAEDITAGNACYDLSGAVYGVYADRACRDRKGVLETKADGQSETVKLDAGDYFVKETGAPEGYALDTQVYSLTVTSGETEVLRVKDIPQSNPVELLLQKADEETGGHTPQGSAALEGAQFRVDFYGGYHTSIPESAPIRTWVLRTGKDGTCRLDDAHKVSGDRFWKNQSGETVLPLGTVVIREVEAPEGYLINDQVYIRQITSEGTKETVRTYQAPTVEEAVIRGDLELVKFAEPADEEADQMEPLSGIIFEITSKTTGKSVCITTDERGFASTRQLGISERGSLPFDTYIVREKNTPPGLTPVDDFEVTISGEGQVLYYLLEDRQVISPVRLVKADCTTGQVIPAADVTFQLLDEEKEPVRMETHYPDTEVHEVFRTDETGSFLLPEKLPAGVYYFRELSAPEGYVLSREDLKFEITEGHDWDEPLTVTFEDAPAMGCIELRKTDGDAGYPLAGAEFTVTAAEDIVTPDGTLRLEKGETADVLTTGYDGTARSKRLFLGRYLVTETKQPSGYVLPEEPWSVELAYKDQETELVMESLVVENTPVRVRLRKTEEGTDAPLAGVAFEIWKKEADAAQDAGTGTDSASGAESTDSAAEPAAGTVVTGEDGEILLERLMPGTYCIRESQALPGYVSDGRIREFTVSQDGRISGREEFLIPVVNERTEITHTVACRADTGGKDAYPGVFTIADTVRMENLQPGETYTLRGVLADQETGSPVTDRNGDQIRAEKIFTPEKSAEEVDVVFEDADLSGCAGQTVVVFETLYQGDVKISSHEDPDAAEQQIRVRSPKLRTTAQEPVSGTQEAPAQNEVCIRDTVSYTDVIPGNYVIRGILMDKKSGEPLLAGGRHVTAEREIQISEENGTVDMEFHLDASGLDGVSAVVFESLYPASLDEPFGQKGEPVAAHEDIDSEEQTVTFAAPSGEDSPTPQTGVRDGLALWTAAAGIAGCVLAVIRAVLKKAGYAARRKR